MLSVDEVIDRAWGDGLFVGDAGILRPLAELNSGHPRFAELVTFARWAVLLEGQMPSPAADPPLPDGPASLRVLALGARAWTAAARVDVQRSLTELVALDEALAEPPSEGDTHLRAARCWADLAIAQCALAGGDRETAARRFEAIMSAPGAPLGLRILSRLRLVLQAEGVASKDGIPILDEAARLAEAAGHPAEAGDARLYAGLSALVGGDVVSAEGRLAQAAAQGQGRTHLLGRLLLAVLHGGEQAMQDLAEGLARAAREGDYLAYVAFVVQGARLYMEHGRPADAVMTLSAAIAQLEAAGPELAEPVVEERKRLRATLGEEAYERACRDAAALFDRR